MPVVIQPDANDLRRVEHGGQERDAVVRDDLAIGIGVVFQAIGGEQGYKVVLIGREQHQVVALGSRQAWATFVQTRCNPHQMPPRGVWQTTIRVQAPIR